jgi:uncharacterized protein YndB with AHSA1/START domain
MGVVDGLLSPVEVRRRVPGSPEATYEVLADPRTYPRWLVGAQRIRHVDPSFPAPDAGFDHSVGPTQDVTIDDDTRSLQADPPHRLVLDVHIGPVTGIVEFRLARADDGTDLRFRERLTGPAAALTPLLRPLLYARNLVSARRLERLLASSGPARRGGVPAADAG